MVDLINRQDAINTRRYTFGNDEFSLEAAYHDCKLVFDGITDDDSFQEADTGLILYYANEIIYALQEALKGKDTNALTNDCISRKAAIDKLKNNMAYMQAFGCDRAIMLIRELPSAQPTLYGYNVEHLAYIARVMEKEGVTAEYAVRTFDDMSRVIKMIIDEIQQKVEETLNGRSNQPTGCD